MALTEVPIELSSTPGIVDNSTATAITIDASQNVTLSANLTVNGDLITFGDANTDSIDFVADIGSNLTPSGTNTYDLGTTLKKWRDAYISGTADIATLSSASSTIGTLTVSTTATIPYDNVTSGLTAINVQSALDELSVLAGGGNVGSQANFDVYEFTATAAQATFDLNATYSETYVPGYIQVYLNGLLLSETDYVASNGSVVVLNDPAELSDILAIVVLDSFNTATQLRVLSIDASASDDAVSVDSSDNVTLLAELRGPATFVIDPAAIGDNTGTVQIKGNLQVDGTQTTINSTTLDVTDLNITVASGAADAAAANGAGITVDGAAANITYTSVTDSWDFNKEIIGSSNIVTSGFNRFVANSTSAGDYVRVYGADGTGKWDIYGNGANLRIGDNESAGIVQIDTGMYVSGNVGIGTSSPSEPLTVLSAQDYQITAAYNVANSTSYGYYGIKNNNTGNPFYFHVGGSERMRIDASGNVGIGQAPAALFHVVETDGGAPDAIIRIQSDDTANSKSLLQFLGRNVSNVATYATVHTDAVAAGTNAPIVFSQGANEANERMRIDENGNVGIGTSSFNATYVPRLQVTSTATDGTGGVLIQNYLPTLTLEDISGGAATSQIQQDQTNMLFKNNGAERLRIDSLGGITAASQAGGHVVFNSNTVDADFRVAYNGGTHALYVDGATGYAGIGTAAPESITHIKDSGNVSTTLQIESAASQYAPVINFDGIVGASADYLLGEINGSWDTHTNVVSAIRFESGADTTNKDDGLISFWTSSSGPTLAERMRILADGSVVQGNTVSLVASNFSNQAGAAWHKPDGHYEIATTSNVAPLEIGKNNANDGSILVFRKQGTTVGSIGTQSGDLNIGSTDCGLLFNDGTPIIIPANVSTNAVADASIDLGYSAGRFKDLYLSGGVVFGDAGGSGSPSSNTLDSYEEGTYTADLYEVGGATLRTVTGRYRKVGKVCTVSVRALGGTTGGAGIVRSNLPFATETTASGATVLAYSVSNGGMLAAFVFENTSYVEFVDTLGSISTPDKMIGSDISANSRTYFTITYITA